ncbi:MAG TPA: hypothetical protein VM122_00880 [Usitatibacter sp.]|nr:hypothetical protein [Usitatibacter sp.]
MRTRRTRLRRGLRRPAIIAALAAFAALVCVDPPRAANSSALPADFPVVTLDRVFHRSGNNPFDPRDPLAAVAPRGFP